MEKFSILFFLSLILGLKISEKVYQYKEEIVVNQDKWESDFFPIEEFKFYELTFYSLSAEKNYWAIFFFDENKNQLLADNYSSFDSSEKFAKNQFFFRGKCRAKYGKLIFHKTKKENQSFKIKEISIKKTTDKKILEYLNKEKKKIPEVKKFKVEKKFIPETLSRLKKGEKIRIVMLGDSIINDIGNSFYDVLIKSVYPKAKIEVITSVKGGTGCWYYEKENRVKEFVLDYKPDLLIIGGISNRDDVESIRNVIRQVREKQNPEIIVMSKAVGKEGDPRTNPQWTDEIVENTYRDRLRKLAEQEKIEFFDIEKYWGEYIKNSNLPYDLFLRDPVHANELGRVVLAYLLFYYFVD